MFPSSRNSEGFWPSIFYISSFLSCKSWCCNVAYLKCSVFPVSQESPGLGHRRVFKWVSAEVWTSLSALSLCSSSGCGRAVKPGDLLKTHSARLPRHFLTKLNNWENRWVNLDGDLTAPLSCKFFFLLPPPLIFISPGRNKSPEWNWMRILFGALRVR